jgi:DMSO/TMAO reductase YedYZ molybdopterin-dependent catalytic subunit
MSDIVSRRRLITRGLAAAAGVSGLAVGARIASHYGLIPPDGGGIWGVGETLTYATQRLLTSHHSLAREFNPSQVSKVVPVSGDPPQTEPYARLRAGGFVDWRLALGGIVARSYTFSLAELKRMPARSQITHQACEEGWSFIAQWTGVPLGYVLNLAGVSSKAKYVVSFSYDGAWDSLDLADAFHPQTFLAYGLNGQDLPAPNGAPIRLRVARQLGYKSVKFLSHITVTDDLQSIGKGLGTSKRGYSWYAGI